MRLLMDALTFGIEGSLSAFAALTDLLSVGSSLVPLVAIARRKVAMYDMHRDLATLG